ncbi:MAG: ROK family protein [Planctomycetes bacterium]|nr:ROK family protein [Planctomycetota bacterium]
MSKGPVTLSIDVGGSNIKAMPLDPKGKPLAERIKLPTPRPATPAAVVAAVAAVAAVAEKSGAFDRVSVGFPGVIRDGCVLTAVNFDGRWSGFDLQAAVQKKLKKPTRVLNDADMQGYGAIHGIGVELTVTLGTGVGSGLFVDGKLVPNLELGHHALRKGETYEEQLGQKALDRVGKRRWKKRVKLAIAQIERAFWPRRLCLGGGNARLIDWKLPAGVEVVPNEYGILGGIALWNDTK